MPKPHRVDDTQPVSTTPFWVAASRFSVAFECVWQGASLPPPLPNKKATSLSQSKSGITIGWRWDCPGRSLPTPLRHMTMHGVRGPPARVRWGGGKGLLLCLAPRHLVRHAARRVGEAWQPCHGGSGPAGAAKGRGGQTLQVPKECKSRHTDADGHLRWQPFRGQNAELFQVNFVVASPGNRRKATQTQKI